MELKLDQWATTPPVGYPGTVSPPPGKRSAGFTNGEEPPAGYFNYAWDALADTQNELANLITGAGLTRSESNLSQVLAAVTRLVNRRAELAAVTQWTEIGTLAAAVTAIACTTTNSNTIATCAANPSLRYASSLDTWSSQSAGSAYTGVFADICWSEAFNKSYAVGAGGEIQSASSLTFARCDTGGPNWVKCAAGANAVVVMDAAGVIKRSTDGVTFTTSNAAFPEPGATMSGLAYSPALNRFCAVGNASLPTYPMYMGDQNGANWVPATTPISHTLSPPVRVIWSPEANCFFASSSQAIHRSSDGMVWSLAAPDAGAVIDMVALPEHVMTVCRGTGTDTVPPNYIRMFRLSELNGVASPNTLQINLRYSPSVAGDAFSQVIRVPAVAGMMFGGRLLGVCSSGRIRVSGYVG